MNTNWTIGLQRAYGPGVLIFSDGAFWVRSAPRRVAKDLGKGFLLAGVLVILAACLAVGLAIIVLETFGLDPALRPFSAEYFNVALQRPFDTGLQSARVLFGLAAILCFVASAGTHLILSYRARGALASYLPTTSIPFNMAERWECRAELSRFSAISFAEGKGMTGT